jgi:catechol 2,3-dioxygenase
MTAEDQTLQVERPYGLAPPGFRLPDATRVGAVRLQIADMQRSIEYYTRVLGLTLLRQATETTALGSAGSVHPLIWLHEGTAVKPAPGRGAFGLYHFAILLPERGQLGRFASHLSSIGARVGMADHLVSEALYLTDPDGLGIEVYADRSRDAWRHRGREIAMATEPLDVGDLTAAGGGLSWKGVPPGTTVGHMHLHVGSLDEAEAFYHRALGFDKTVWSYPGALFFSAGGYHHHLGTNTWSPGPSAARDQARLLEWELVVPGEDDAAAAARSLRTSGYSAEDTGAGWTTQDPWGTRFRIRAESDGGTIRPRARTAA